MERLDEKIVDPYLIIYMSMLYEKFVIAFMSELEFSQCVGDVDGTYLHRTCILPIISVNLIDIIVKAATLSLRKKQSIILPFH